MTLYVILNSQGVAVNNAEVTLKFPTDLVDVVSVSKGGSIFSLWVEDPSFSNSSGVISFNGGIPTPGFVGTQGSLVSILIRAKKAGRAEFVFSGAAVRANDGLGTNVLEGQSGKVITIVGKEEPTEPTPTEPTPTTEPTKAVPAVPGALMIYSLTHPDQEKWYQESNPVFQWKVPKGADAVQADIASSVAGAPKALYKPAISDKSVKITEDGTWYFKVRAHVDGEWGPTAVYAVSIDTTAPEKNKVEFNYDNVKQVLNITSLIQDLTSGLDHYELSVNNNLVKSIPAQEFIDGRYSLDLKAAGDNSAKLVAFDKAGNSTEVLGTFHSVAIPVPELNAIPSLVAVDSQLIINGRTQNPDTEVVINIKHGADKIITINTKSNADLLFSVITPKLKSGNYEIWAEIITDGQTASSAHLHTKASSHLLLTIGALTVTAWPVISLIIIIVLSLVAGAYYLGRRLAKPVYGTRTRATATVAKRDNVKILLLSKKHMERHLNLLQNTRRGRILTREEKEIKKAIESDLDDIDRTIDKQRR